MRLLAFIALVVAATATIHFKETFDKDYADRWVTSQWKQASGEAGKWGHTAGEFYGDAEADKGLATTQDARFYAISTKFPSFSNEGKDLVIQFSVKFPQNIDCGGGYIKVLGANPDLEHFGGESPYNIMFGPDICGSSTKKVHVIFHYPKKDTNLLIKKEIRAESDRLTHVYTLIVHPDNTYEVRIDGSKKESGSLESDWDFLPAKTIKDPSVSKPSDWVDEAMIDDPADKKPEGYDNAPRTIPDPEAEKPADWDEDSDGEWEAPQIENPEFKGEWRPKRIPNPAHKGPWVHPEIENPEYQPDPQLYRFSFGGVGMDIWQVKSGTIFDNLIITDSVAEAEEFLAETYGKHKDAEKASLDTLEKKKRDEEEAGRKRAEDERKAAEEASGDDEDEDEEDEDDDEHLHDDL